MGGRGSRSATASTIAVRMTGKETYSYYSSDEERIRDWLRFWIEEEPLSYEGDNNTERANLQIRRDANVLRTLLKQAENNKMVEYEKTLDDFKKKKDDEKELFVHAALIKNGKQFRAIAEVDKKNRTNVDLKIGKEYWEIKSPISNGSSSSSMRFVEKNIAKAVEQFKNNPKTKNKTVNVLFNCRYTTISDDEIKSKLTELYASGRTGVAKIVMVDKKGKLISI